MKKSFFVGLSTMLVAGLILAACESSPPTRQLTPNERLLDAAIAGNLAGVRSALENGANANFQNRYGATALMYAAGRSGNIEMVKYLVERGADLNLRDTDGWTALHIAFSWNRPIIARYLIDSGININARAKDGKSALNMAYEKGEMELYDYLIAHGAVEFEPNPVAQQPPAPAPQTNVYIQPSAPAQSPAPAPSAPTFQSGTYAFSGSNITMSLSGYQATAYSGYTQVAWGTYRINGNQLVISFLTGNGAGASLQGKTFAYTITSSTSFSGSGETWVRTGY